MSVGGWAPGRTKGEPVLQWRWPRGSTPPEGFDEVDGVLVRREGSESIKAKEPGHKPPSGSLAALPPRVCACVTSEGDWQPCPSILCERPDHKRSNVFRRIWEGLLIAGTNDDPGAGY